MSFESILFNVVFPAIFGITLVLVFPFPRFMKKIAHGAVHLKFARIINFKIGSIFVLTMFGLMINALLSYYNSIQPHVAGMTQA